MLKHLEKLRSVSSIQTYFYNIVQYLGTWDAVQIGTLFYYTLNRRNYIHLQLFITRLRVYTITILTRQYYILDVFTYSHFK
jgi:hypothetical protein